MLRNTYVNLKKTICNEEVINFKSLSSLINLSSCLFAKNINDGKGQEIRKKLKYCNNSSTSEKSGVVFRAFRRTSLDYSKVR